MDGEKSKRLTIGVRAETKDLLDSVKHPGQSYDGLIQELVLFWADQHRVSESVSEPLDLKAPVS